MVCGFYFIPYLLTFCNLYKWRNLSEYTTKINELLTKQQPIQNCE